LLSGSDLSTGLNLASHRDPEAEFDAVTASALLDGDAIEDLLSSVQHDSTTYLSDVPTDVPTVPTATTVTADVLGAARDFDLQHRGDQLARKGVNPTFKSEELQDPARVGTNTDIRDSDSESDDEKEEEEASEYVERLLEQMKNESTDSKIYAESIPSVVDEHKDQNYDDNALDARFAALNLPSVPESAPHRSSRRDTDDPECCCICYDNATTRCRDCEQGSQLFCARCWWEMHMDGDADDAFRYHHREPFHR
jgi:hypothetical protein